MRICGSKRISNQIRNTAAAFPENLFNTGTGTFYEYNYTSLSNVLRLQCGTCTTIGKLPHNQSPSQLTFLNGVCHDIFDIIFFHGSGPSLALTLWFSKLRRSTEKPEYLGKNHILKAKLGLDILIHGNTCPRKSRDTFQIRSETSSINSPSLKCT